MSKAIGEGERETPYNAPQLLAMKQDIADRSFRIKMTGMLITGLFIAAGVAAMFLLPGSSLALAKPLIYGAMAVGGAVTTVVTMREAKKLEIDEHYIQSYMQGKNYWGEGYRKEVAEHGYSGPPLTMQGPPMRSHQRSAGRE
jgi:hypothetical protein